MNVMEERTGLERADFMERHYTLGELAKGWHMSINTIRPWFIDQPGVIKFGVDKLKKGRKRTHVTLRVPESVAREVYRRRTGRDQPAKG
jgi:hypothetical protein